MNASWMAFVFYADPVDALAFESMENAMERERRNRILVNPSLQVYLLVYAGLLALIFIGGLLLTDYYFSTSVQELFAKMAENPQNAALIESIHRIEELKKIIVICVSSGFLVVWMIQAYVSSNRIAGPIFKATRYLTQVAKSGKATGLSFRKGDFFHELAEAVNKALPPEKR
jgi:hypothetical protein